MLMYLTNLIPYSMSNMSIIGKKVTQACGSHRPQSSLLRYDGAPFDSLQLRKKVAEVTLVYGRYNERSLMALISQLIIKGHHPV